MHQLAQFMAAQLRALRQQRGWSLTEAAQHTGVSKAMLGQIERSESSPTVATLWKIATGFSVPFTTFIESGSLATEPARPVIHDGNQPISITPLFPHDVQFNMDMLLIEMAPGSQSHSDPHQPGVVEHVWVVRGILAIKVDTRWLRLTQGETLRFAADVPHSYANAGNTVMQFHNVVHYPNAKG